MMDTTRMDKPMTTPEPHRNFFQTALYNFFALYLGVTPPAPGKEGFYATLLLVATVIIIGIGYLFARLLINQMFS